MRYQDYEMKLHHDDRWLDEIRLQGDDTGPVLRLILRERYKTSGLSGDEWRFSAAWQAHASIHTSIVGDCVAAQRPWEKGWYDFDTGYGGSDPIQTACTAFYPGIFGSQQPLHTLHITAIHFMRKRRLLYESTFDTLPQSLLVVAGHLPWALVMACDEPLGTDEAWNDMQSLCFQPGCVQEAVSTYRLQKCYNADGDEVRNQSITLAGQGSPYIRRFCTLHLRRGDCAREDADTNYDVIEGPGPESAEGWQAYESPSQTMYIR